MPRDHCSWSYVIHSRPRLPSNFDSINFLPPPRPSSPQKHYLTEMGGSEEYAPGSRLKVRFRQTLDPHLTLSGRKLRVSTGFFDIFPIKFPSSSDNLDRIVI